jgi:hypothetical protein
MASSSSRRNAVARCLKAAFVVRHPSVKAPVMGACRNTRLPGV